MELPRRLGESATSGAATGPRARSSGSHVHQQLSLPLHSPAGSQDRERTGKDRRREFNTRRRPPRCNTPCTRGSMSQPNGATRGREPYLAFPLLVKIVPPDLRSAVMENLEQTILEKNSGHIDAGMHGTYFLLKYLMEQDRNDLIYQMVSKRDYPSWGFMLDHGATTIWEDSSGEMSHIHDTLISVGSWFIQGIGGIRIDEKSPGFRHFLIKPGIVGDLTYAHAEYHSPYGTITSKWRLKNGIAPHGCGRTAGIDGDGLRADNQRRGRH